MIEFFAITLAAGFGIALLTGPLGAFVVWQRMAYFSDTLSHSALLGIALGLLFSLPLSLSVILLCSALAILMVFLQKQQQLSTDTVLGILAHSSLALGLFVISFIDNVRLDLMALLFGDLLTINTQDLALIYGGGSIVLFILIRYWNPLLTIVVHEELARIEGFAVERLKILLVLLLAIVIAVAMKIVGVLLISAMLIIPAATVRRFSRSPEQMATRASLCGMLAVAVGLLMSYQWDTPTGPSIVVACFVLFLIGQWLPRSSSPI